MSNFFKHCVVLDKKQKMCQFGPKCAKSGKNPKQTQNVPQKGHMRHNVSVLSYRKFSFVIFFCKIAIEISSNEIIQRVFVSVPGIVKTCAVYNFDSEFLVNKNMCPKCRLKNGVAHFCNILRNTSLSHHNCYKKLHLRKTNFPTRNIFKNICNPKFC